MKQGLLWGPVVIILSSTDHQALPEGASDKCQLLLLFEVQVSPCPLCPVIAPVGLPGHLGSGCR